ncbi:hypothetical protein WV31_05520 [Magnetospirillum sp. ME-1]|nr:hypothetical protein WV31_05520 [Magnetospirillum sp. ME-1]
MYVIWLKFINYFPILPYRSMLKRIDDLLDGLTARTVSNRQRDIWAPARWVHTLIGGAQETGTVDRKPIDPRAVEAAFISIIRDCTRSYWELPGGKWMRLGIPSPEITFVFDEMDKLWAKSGHYVPAMGDKAGADGPRKDETTAPASGGIQFDERQRAIMTNRLLSDLKRVIADSPARFIFVGGRLLHDEWLADMHSGAALLTSIFDAEMYIPSLLTDTHSGHHVQGEKKRLDEMVQFYLEKRHQIAVHYQEQWQAENHYWFPWFRRRPERGLVFMSAEDGKPPKPAGLEVWHTVYHGKPVLLPSVWQAVVLRDLCQYLTYRSTGNPKRLKEMVADLIRLKNRVLPDREQATDPVGRSTEIICLNPPAIVRIQFLAEVYRHLTAKLGPRLLHRDDKMALSAFDLTDNLFKFHRRAFSWRNIERVDELTHIHRAPDIRELLSDIVGHFGHRYLHRVVNGMYDFRFRGEISQEISYISQYNESEMAALNFTLDESQALKASYRAQLTGREPESLDILAALGELYEYDQEYDIACQHYRRALRLADQELHALLAGTGGHPTAKEAEGILGRILDNPAGTYPVIPLGWALTRLRLMMQVGMASELSGDFERAEGEYVEAYHLARKFLTYYIRFDYSLDDGTKTPPRRHTLAPEGETLKHAGLLYQPLFAIAWVSEKLWCDIDTSSTIVEKAVAELRATLPFVRDGKTHLSERPDKVTHSGFALIISDIHNKSGDLYFFKGRSAIPSVNIKGYVTEGRDISTKRTKQDIERYEGAEGYLLRSHFHYCMALHEIRRYTNHRRQSSAYKLQVLETGWRTLAGGNSPSFLKRAAAGVVANLAEGILARVSVCSLIIGKPSIPAKKMPVPGSAAPLFDTLRTWLHLDHVSDPAHGVSQNANALVWQGEWLSDWFGKWNDRDDAGNHRLSFNTPHHADSRLLISLHLSMAGAEMRAEDGHFDDAATEMVMVAQTVARYLWSFRVISALPDDTDANRWLRDHWNDGAEALRSYRLQLFEFGVYALERAGHWFTLARDTGRSSKDSNWVKDGEIPIEHDIIPTDAVTAACSLGLALESTDEENWRVEGYSRCFENSNKEHSPWSLQLKRLLNLIELWKAPTLNLGSEKEMLRFTLYNNLRIHRYPVLNRMRGLKVMLDSLLLDASALELSLNRFGKGNSGPICVTPQVLFNELDTLFERFNAPHLFPFSDIGQSAALFVLIGQGDERIRRTAIRYLKSGMEMYSLGTAYYTSLSKMFYLYDDFNDRVLHHTRAQEMASWELTSILLGQVTQGR